MCNTLIAICFFAVAVSNFFAVGHRELINIPFGGFFLQILCCKLGQSPRLS